MSVKSPVGSLVAARKWTRLATVLFILLAACSTPTMAMYNPDMGRWLSRDPVGYRGGRSLYLYVNGSPANFIDPTGLWSLKFGPDVSPEDQRRISDAVSSVCDRVREANRQLKNVSECAEERLGDSFQDAKRKLQKLEQECNSDTNLEFDTGPIDNGSGKIIGITDDPSPSRNRRFERENHVGPPEGPQPYVILNTDIDGEGGSNPGSPGNVWHDNGSFPANDIVLHELVHVIEIYLKDQNRDDQRLRHDSPYNLQDIATSKSFGDSTLGESVQAAEDCCSGGTN